MCTCVLAWIKRKSQLTTHKLTLAAFYFLGKPEQGLAVLVQRQASRFLPLSCQGVSLPDSQWVTVDLAGMARVTMSHFA